MKALEVLPKKLGTEKKESLKDYFGRLPDTFGDGLEYQKKARNEWK
jgi:hypothetical protein